MSCAEPGLSHALCTVQIHSMGFLSPGAQVLLLGAACVECLPSVFLRWARRNSCFIQKTYWGLLPRSYLQQRRIKGISWLQFSLVLPIKDGSTFQQRLWCQTLLSLLMHSSLCRLTGLQELFESLTQQCFTCNKTKGGFKLFCISGWKYGVFFPRFFPPWILRSTKNVFIQYRICYLVIGVQRVKYSFASPSFLHRL